MWLLVSTTITASFFDSLNPSAIAQQMLLQAMVRRKQQIWFFIAGIGTANLTMGLAVYYGLARWLSHLLGHLAGTYPRQLAALALAAGLICLGAGIRLLVRTRRRLRDGGGESLASDASPAAAQLSPLTLFLMGVAFCAVELTSAFPYFGFLAMMSGYDPAVPVVLLLTALYNFMYLLPLILLYFGYNRLQGTAAIHALEQILGRISAYIVPVVVSLAGVLLIGYGAGL